MIKKYLLCAFLFASLMQVASAIPVYPRPVVITQPDGTQLTIVGHGDEFMNFTTTLDGYTVVKGADNFFRYADVVDGKLVASDVIARDASARTISETAFLAPRAKNLKPEMNFEQKMMRESRREMAKDLLLTHNTTGNHRKVVKKGDFRGLVILVNYSDRKFRLGDKANAIFSDMMNKDNYQGYEDPKLGYQKYTGSVRDYFIDNSDNQFRPKFDVFGPVDIANASTDAEQVDNASTIIRAALNAVDDQVDFSNYDFDKDGVVDMFYVIFAGYSSNYIGNNDKYLWPHASYLVNYDDYSNYYVTHDNKRMGRYACSAELYGLEQNSNGMLEGIGVIAHEFSHVLGFMDHYDTENKGHDVVSDWDLMASGTYFNHGRTPVGYSAFERYSAGFMPLENITTTGERMLEPITTKSKGYRIDTPQKSPSGKVLEYFVLENRKRVKWDAYLPGEGMLITKIDSTQTYLWSSNKVNATDRTCVQILRATGGLKSSEYNTFPGKGHVSFITNETTPNLQTYTKKRCQFNILDIRKEGDNVYFNVVDDGYNPIKVPENALFYESFYFCADEGGNDGNYKYVGSSNLFADNAGWTGNNIHSASKCAVVGQSSFFIKEQNIVSPAITLEAGKEYKLSFSALPYSTRSNPPLKVSVAEGNGKLSISSVELEQEKWNHFTATLTGSGKVKLSFGRNKAAFYLDTVLVGKPSGNGTTGVETISVDATDNGGIYNLAGQKVNDSYKGVVIKNGKKFLQR